MGGSLFKEPYQLSVIYVSQDDSVWERPEGSIHNNNNNNNNKEHVVEPG
jgi:hypothetical protein